MRYAVVKQFRVVNIIEWDGKTEFDTGGHLHSIEGAPQVGIGWKTNKAGDWIDPNPPSEPEPARPAVPSVEERLTAIEAELAALKRK